MDYWTPCRCNRCIVWSIQSIWMLFTMDIYVHMHVCLSVCMYVWMYVYMYVCMYVCIYVCMNSCMYVQFNNSCKWLNNISHQSLCWMIETSVHAFVTTFTNSLRNVSCSRTFSSIIARGKFFALANRVNKPLDWWEFESNCRHRKKEWIIKEKSKVRDKWSREATASDGAPCKQERNRKKNPCKGKCLCCWLSEYHHQQHSQTAGTHAD